MFSLSSLNGITELTNDIVMLVFLGLVTIICVFTAVWFIAANINKPEREMLGKIKTTSAAWTVSAAGLAIRIAFSLVMVGYLGINAAQPYSSSGGLLELYQFIKSVIGGTATPGEIYPLTGYVAVAMGGFLDLIGVYNTNGNLFMQLFIRLPYMLCDAAAALVLFKIAKKYAGSYVALGLAAIYMFCPVFFFGSAMWGSELSILSLLILLALYYMTQKNFLALTISYGLALLTAKEALYFLPVFGVFYVYHFIKSLRLNRNLAEGAGQGLERKTYKSVKKGAAIRRSNRKFAGKAANNNAKAESQMTFKQRFFDSERGLVYRIPIYIVASLALMYAISLPMLRDINYNFFTWFADVYVYPFTRVSSFGKNAFTIYNLFGKNNALIAGAMGDWLVALISIGFIVIATALVYVLYSSKKNRANMVVIACYVVVTLSVYSMGFSEMSLLPILVALLLAFALVKDKRILHIFGLLALAVVINGCAVMINAGFFASVPISDFAKGTGSALLSDSIFGQVMNTVCTVIAILTHLYFTIVILDISVSNKRVLFAPRNNSFGESLKDWFRFK